MEGTGPKGVSPTLGFSLQSTCEASGRALAEARVTSGRLLAWTDWPKPLKTAGGKLVAVFTGLGWSVFVLTSSFASLLLWIRLAWKNLRKPKR